MLIFGPSMEIKTPYPEKMHDFIWEAFVQCEVIQFGSTLIRIKPQQICEDGNLGSMGEYANLFVALASSTIPWQKQITNQFFFQQYLSWERKEWSIACWFHLYCWR